jgi:transposase, IS30 family
MKYQHLAREERSQIEALKSTGLSIRAIARIVKRSPATISRECKRNSVGKKYGFDKADRLSKKRRAKASTRPPLIQGALQERVELHLKAYWSPEQISGRLKKEHLFVSHTTLYKYVWDNKGSGGFLYQCLRHQGKKYNHKGKGAKTSGRGLIPNRIDISERPQEVEEKLRTGDWEADTLIGKSHQGAIVSLVDRATKFTLLKKVEKKTSFLVTKAIVEKLNTLSITHHTITFDNGKEFASHESVHQATQAKPFFARPYHSWERGLNEHTNGLVRQYVPKATFFKTVTDDFIEHIQEQLNNRPRKVLKFRTPAEAMHDHLLKPGVALQG